MAILDGNEVAVILAGTTISDHVTQVTLNRERDAVEITAMTNDDHIFTGGLRSDTVVLEFLQDFASSSVNSLIDDAIGTYLQLKLIPVAGTVTATNPSYTMSCFIGQWQPINATPESVMTASVTWPVKSLTKSTSA